MGTPSYGNSGTGTSVFGYTMEGQGQAQVLDLATNSNFFANGYFPQTNMTTNKTPSWTIDPRLTQQVPVPSRVAPVPSNGTPANVMPSFGSSFSAASSSPVAPRTRADGRSGEGGTRKVSKCSTEGVGDTLAFFVLTTPFPCAYPFQRVGCCVTSRFGDAEECGG